MVRRFCPSPGTGKQWLAGALLAVAILAGCGGSGRADTRLVRGNGFSFQAPLGWQVARDPRTVTVKRAAAVIQVQRFPLARAYTPALFDRVQPEIERVARQLSEQLHARLSGPRIVAVADERAWQYDYTLQGFREQLTFVLRGKVEFQLYCRRAIDGDTEPCRELVDSFTFI